MPPSLCGAVRGRSPALTALRSRSRRSFPVMEPRQADVSIPLQSSGWGAAAPGPRSDPQPRDYVLWSVLNVLLWCAVGGLGCLGLPPLVYSIKVRGGPGIPARRLGSSPDRRRNPHPGRPPDSSSQIPRLSPSRDPRHVPTLSPAPDLPSSPTRDPPTQPHSHLFLTWDPPASFPHPQPSLTPPWSSPPCLPSSNPLSHPRIPRSTLPSWTPSLVSHPRCHPPLPRPPMLCAPAERRDRGTAPAGLTPCPG